jgi:hypothetical protein
MSARSLHGVLQEHMIFQKTRTRNLSDVAALNMWGCDLEDVSIIAQLPNVETLSLPLNKISTLAPFGCCKNLQSLLLRDNQIAFIDEIDHLRDLPHLITLSLINNPVAELPNYREQVIAKLPQLRKLDDVAIPRRPLQRRPENVLPTEQQPQKAPAKSEISVVDVERVLQPRPIRSKDLHPNDANMLAAVLSLIPELSRDSLRVVLEAIEKRCM